jgi:hypothetical protein
MSGWFNAFGCSLFVGGTHDSVRSELTTISVVELWVEGSLLVGKQLKQVLSLEQCHPHGYVV